MRFSHNIILNTTPLNNIQTNPYWLNTYLSNDLFDKNSFLKLTQFNFFLKNYKNQLNGFSLKKKSLPLVLKSDFSWDFFTIFFLRKERMYTKLKYSRVTQFDISSGAVAALFAGFIGFLISEKFGFELVDSGDFYFLFMYIVFLVFSLKLLLRINDVKNETYSFFSLKWFFLFVIQVYNLLLNRFFK